MQNLANLLIAKYALLQTIPAEFVYVGIQILFGLVLLLLFVAPFAGITSWVERRIAARMMDRIGPNRVGPVGFLQWLADGLKSILKEDLIPAKADGPLFRMAPYLVFTGMFSAFVSIPFSSALIIADLNVGIFYILAVTSLVVVGILMCGWASNNKYSLLGGMRSAAQIVSYEIPSGLGILTVVLLAGSLSMQEIIKAQGAAPWNWFLFNNPFSMIAFFILFISSLAEGNRTPFDIPEAESEIVSGYNTEYSGMRFLFFFFAEWANLYLIAAIAVTLFMGGWQIPQVLRHWALGINPWLPPLFELITFVAKSLAVVFVIIWIRWTLPRVRVDQLMALCWKYLTPIGFVCVLGTAVWMVLLPQGSLFTRYFLLSLALVTLLYFFWRVYYQLRYSNVALDFRPLL
ncbi:MAG: NADH-quinone oxidoreductase subunit NuoH [Deltaproteobacteria bacterium]|nr:NADH-quinone oxidoreductase subunit NuoH [Deltaproteobacteria bacterium]